MELQGERIIPASVDATWAALNDTEVLKSCIAGCESLVRGEGSEADTMNAVMAVKVGPVSAKFKGKVQLSNMNAPTSYTLNFEGQGGVAGHGKGAADVSLSPQAGGTLLKYVARAQVGGKLAQVGSRLIDAAAAKIAEDFFAAFEQTLKAASDTAAGQTPSSNAVSAAAAPTASNKLWLWGGIALVVAMVLWLLLRR
jgi:uncharacterized protein